MFITRWISPVLADVLRRNTYFQIRFNSSIAPNTHLSARKELTGQYHFEDKRMRKPTLTHDSLEQMQSHAAEAASLMKAHGNECRLMVLCALAECERSVSELNEIIRVSQSTLSQQLAKLRQQGLVETRRESQAIFYSLAAGPADRVVHLLQENYCTGDK
jgi:DNA-binding transcriptional ArsR family regulator